jgi:preprotein translocase subunit SecA
MSENFETIVKEVFPFDDAALDRLFDTEASKFEDVLKTEAKELYASREVTFGEDSMRKFERDIYLQILDNLWMQHLENMDHLREGIHWMSVGQQDPLVEYRRRGQQMFESMQQALRHDVVMYLFNAVPVEDLEQPTETELTRAARQSISNADQISTTDNDLHENDFVSQKQAATEAKKAEVKRKKARKTERQRKTAARKRK